MPRPKKLDRGVSLHLRIPESILAKVQLELYSELEGRVPFGAMSELAAKLFTDWLSRRAGQ